MKPTPRLWPFRASSLAAVLVVAAIPLGGCTGPKNRAVVSGKVTYDGKPVTGGQVHLHPSGAAETPYPIALKADGTFSVSGVPSGDFVVTVETETVRLLLAPGGRRTPRPPPGVDTPEAPALPTADRANVPRYVRIPRRYADPRTSPLRWTVTEGNNDLGLNLEGPLP